MRHGRGARGLRQRLSLFSSGSKGRPKRHRAILFSALAAFTLPVHAVELGELRVLSALGEPLEAIVALSATDAPPRPDCFSTDAPRTGDLPTIARTLFDVEPDGAGWRLRIRTRASVSEPALQLRLKASCGNRRASSRDYELLLDPRPEASLPAFRSRPGDTLASLAAAIYPRRPAVREAYVQALRAANPALATLAPGDALPEGTPYVLPDLRRFSLSLAVTPPSSRPAPRSVVVPSSAPMPAPPRRPKRETPAQGAADSRVAAAGSRIPAPDPQIPATESRTPAPAAQPRPQREAGRFVLRLSAPEVDLNRSRGISDSERKRLRERLLVLDADDQVSALLAMRSSLQRLEGRVAELQLKLSALPVTAAPQPSPSAPIPVTPPAKSTPPAVPAPSAPVAAPPAPASDGRAGPGQSPETGAKPPAPQPGSALPFGVEGWWIWGGGAILLLAAAIVVWRSRMRLGKPMSTPVAEPAPPRLVAAPVKPRAEPRVIDEPPPALSPGHRLEASAETELATHVPGADPATLRLRYIEERFPEIANGTIVPNDPDSVVKAARLFHEDGAIARAVELLQFTVEEIPDSKKPWLALFEIFRLEGLKGEFAELASRFRIHHDSSEEWRKVQSIGRDMDPEDALFQGIPSGGSRDGGGPAATQAAEYAFDPLAENWLNAPMDFTTVALAASLRGSLLADAGLRDADLIANPLPALKNVEVFTVA